MGRRPCSMPCSPPIRAAPSAWREARSSRASACAALWLLPVAALLPVGGVYADVAWFFSKMAVVTFGGAYAVLAYVAQEAVQSYRWLGAPEMLTGLGLAETTPGPLILVLQFVGFLAGYRAPGSLSGIPGGVVASVLTVWVTFLPCFMFVFLGAPLIERLQENRKLSGALSAVTAAIVGGGGQPGGLVRAACPVPPDGSGGRAGNVLRRAGAGQPGPLGLGAGSGRGPLPVPLQARRDVDPGGLLGREHRAAFRRGGLKRSRLAGEVGLAQRDQVRVGRPGEHAQMPRRPLHLELSEFTHLIRLLFGPCSLPLRKREGNLFTAHRRCLRPIA